MDGNNVNETYFIFDVKGPNGYIPFGYTKQTFPNLIKEIYESDLDEPFTGYYPSLGTPNIYEYNRTAAFTTYVEERTKNTKFTLTCEIQDYINSDNLYLVVVEALNLNTLFEYYSDDKIILNDLFSPNLLNLIKTYPNVKIVFMDSREGAYPHDIKFLIKINNFLIDNNIKHKNKVFVSTQNNFIKNLENDKIFSSFENKITVFSNNYCLLTAGRFIGELRSKNNILIENDYEFSIQTDLVKKEKEKYFLMYNRNSSRVHRAYFVNELYKTDLLNKGYVSFFENDDLDKFLNQKNTEYGQLNLSTTDIDNIRDNYKKYTPMYIDNPNAEEVADYHNFLSRKDEYQNTYFTIVSETNAESDYCYITEKTVKPIMNLHPFVVLGNPHTLKVLKEYGFQTFDKWWDESYDNEFDFKKRASMVLDIVKTLCNYSPSDWNSILNEMESILVYNKKLLHNLSTKQKYQMDFFSNLLENEKIFLI